MPYRCGALFALSCVALAQQAPAKPEFEVAAIKVSVPSPDGQVQSWMRADAGLLRYQNVSLKDCIRVAYRVKEFQVAGPEWIGRARFDITAKLPAGSSQDRVPEMLQSLLEERFKLRLHRAPKEHAIYALVALERGPAPTPLEPGAKGTYSVNMGDNGIRLTGAATMATLGELVSRFTDRPVVDQTGLKGMYEFSLVFSGRTPIGSPDGPGSLADALQRYGLSLEPRKGTLEVLFVDSIEKLPTEI